jgi:hypothetical protein
MLSLVSVPQIICDAADGPAAEPPVDVGFGSGEAEVLGEDIPGAIVFSAPTEVVAHPTSKAVEAITIVSGQARLVMRIISCYAAWLDTKLA